MELKTSSFEDAEVDFTYKAAAHPNFGENMKPIVALDPWFIHTRARITTSFHPTIF